MNADQGSTIELNAQKYRLGIIGLGPVAIRKLPSEDLPAVIQAAMQASEKPEFVPFGDHVMVSHTWAIGHVPEIEIVAGCDLDPARVERFRENWGERWPNARLYSDYREMLAGEELDIVTVTTPEHLHAEPTVAAAESGVRAIFCEKPLSTSVADADRMIAACEANKVILSVDYTRRWSPAFHKVRDAIRSGAIGELSFMSASFGGVQAWLFRSGSHLLDAMVFFTGADPVKVSAHLEDGYDDWDVYRGTGGGNATERDPGATGYVVFGNGVRAFFSCLKNTPDSSRDVTITGTKGTIAFKFDGESAELQFDDPAYAYNTIRTTLTPDVHRSRGIEAAYREIVDNIANGTESTSPARDARKSVRIMAGFLRSHQEGGRLVEV